MARARNIKPNFFKNEILGKLDPLISLLFISLWTLADKEGRLEDRPDRILAETFPYRRELSDINGYLTVLVSEGFIHRYEVNGLKLIQIINFRKHQNPHHTEKASEYPEYSEDFKITVKAPLITSPAPADSLLLIPDSLIPDSVSDEANASSSSPLAESPPVADRVPYAKIVDLYHEILPMCPRVGALTTTRKAYIAARWKSGAIPDLETWRDFFTFVSQSKFLTGACDPPEGKKRFVANLEWMTKESNFVKIFERKYHGA